MAKGTEKKKANPVGRPPEFKPEYIQQAHKLCLLGATDAEMGDFFNVSETTINNWKTAYPEFLVSIKGGKMLADSNVADRLYQRAMGFEHDSEELKIVNIGDYQSKVERHKIRKIYPPDTAAAIFWLKNRQSDKWRDKQELDHKNNGKDFEQTVVYIPENNRNKNNPTKD